MAEADAIYSCNNYLLSAFYFQILFWVLGLLK